MNNTTPFVIERTYNAPVQRVWKAITDKAEMKQWYFDNLTDFKPEVGFETEVNVHHSGKDFLHLWKVTDVKPEKSITYRWKYADHPGESFVTFELFDAGNKTKLRLIHTGLESFLTDNDPNYATENFVKGWTHIIGTSFKEFVERNN